MISLQETLRKEELYVAARMQGNGPREAAKIAGWSVKNRNFAYSIEKRPRIVAKLVALRTTSGVAAHDSGDPVSAAVGKPFVVLSLHRIVTLGMEMVEGPSRGTNADGTPAPGQSNPRDLTNANRALDLLSRIGGLVAPSESLKTSVSVDLSRMSESDLAHVLEQQMAKLSPAERRALDAATAGAIVDADVSRDDSADAVSPADSPDGELY